MRKYLRLALLALSLALSGSDISLAAFPHASGANPVIPIPTAITFAPSAPSVLDSFTGTIAAISVTTSNGSPFTGTLGFGPPNNDDSGHFIISGANLNTNGALPSGTSTQNVTVTATENATTISQNLAIAVTGTGGGTQMAAARAAACVNCWFDTATTVATNATMSVVHWACTAQPCSSNGQPGTPPGAPTTTMVNGNSGIEGFFSQWCGGSYDTTHNWVMVGCGSHSEYCGNDLYVFDMATLQWRRINAPSDMTGYGCPGAGGTKYSDGQPANPHTYGGGTFIPGFGTVQIGDCGVQNGGCSTESWKIDLSAQSANSYSSWSAIAALFNDPTGGAAAYDSGTNALYFFKAGFGLEKLSPPYTGTYSAVGSGQFCGLYMSVAIKPNTSAISLGDKGDTNGCTNVNGFQVMSITTGATTATSVGGTASSCVSMLAPGFVYDSLRDRFVGWCGGTALEGYTGSGSSWTMANLTISGGPTPLCSDVNGTNACVGGKMNNGTWGRFVYDAVDDVYCIVGNSAFNHTYCYRPS